MSTNNTATNFFIALAFVAFIAAAAFISLNPSMMGITLEAGNFFARRVGRLVAVLSGALGIILMLVGVMNMSGRLNSSDKLTLRWGPRNVGIIKFIIGISFCMICAALVIAHS